MCTEPPPLFLDPLSPLLLCRDQYKCEYESRLKAELEGIRLQTSVELENLQRSSREVFERENRYRLSRDGARLRPRR